MSIQDITLHESVTTPAVFGGTSHQFGTDGAVVANGVHLVDVAEADYLSRFQLTAKNRPTTFNVKTGAFSKEKRSVSIARPCVPVVNGVVLPGNVTFNSVRIELECHPNAMGDVALLRTAAAEFLLSSASDAFWNRGALA